MNVAITRNLCVADPIAIDQGRDRYNSIIQSTSKVQTLANIVRLYNLEPTSVMEVTEADATQSVVGQVIGGLTNIGARATNSTTAVTLAFMVGSPWQIGLPYPGIRRSEDRSTLYS